MPTLNIPVCWAACISHLRAQRKAITLEVPQTMPAIFWHKSYTLARWTNHSCILEVWTENWCIVYHFPRGYELFYGFLDPCNFTQLKTKSWNQKKKKKKWNPGIPKWELGTCPVPCPPAAQIWVDSWFSFKDRNSAVEEKTFNLGGSYTKLLITALSLASQVTLGKSLNPCSPNYSSLLLENQ